MGAGVRRSYSARRPNELESRLQKAVLNDLSKRKAFSFKCLAANKRGIPDIIVCLKGRFISFELKRAQTNGNVLGKSSPISDIQKAVSAKITNNGGLHYFVSSFDEYDYIADTLEKRFLQA